MTFNQTSIFVQAPTWPVLPAAASVDAQQPTVSQVAQYESPRKRALLAIRSGDWSGLDDVARELATYLVLKDTQQANYASTVVLHAIRHTKRLPVRIDQLSRACGLSEQRCSRAVRGLLSVGSIMRTTIRKREYYVPVGTEDDDFPIMPPELREQLN